MNSIIRFAGLMVLATVYCYAMSIASQSIVNLNLNRNNVTEKETYFEKISPSFSLHTPQSESSTSTAVSYFFQGFKQLFPFLRSSLRTIELFFDAEFTSYNSTAEKIPVHYRKTDLLFPFQYFW